jgi:hypothetical protein
MRRLHQRFHRLTTGALLAALLLATLAPLPTQAAQITARKLTLSTSSASAGATVTYTFNFTVPSATVLASWEAQICTTASGTCTMPTGFVNSTSISQPTNLGDASGWTGNNATAGSLRMSKSGNVAAPTGSQTVVFSNVTNPTTANQSFYARITTYTGSTWTGAVDTGVVAASTAGQIQLSGTMDESLVFCAGTSITGTNCGTIAGTTVNFGTFSPSSTSSGTSVMAASTNGTSGYSITVNGATLTSGGNTITALATQTAAAVGTEQFGLNLRDNATPNVGTNPSGSGTGTYAANYGTVDQYRFVTGDSVASVGAATDANTFTASYIVNVGGATEAGTYTATMTYICTATF